MGAVKEIAIDIEESHGVAFDSPVGMVAFGLLLAITAPTDEQADRATAEVFKLSMHLSDADNECAQAIAQKLAGIKS